MSCTPTPDASAKFQSSGVREEGAVCEIARIYNSEHKGG